MSQYSQPPAATGRRHLSHRTEAVVLVIMALLTYAAVKFITDPGASLAEQTVGVTCFIGVFALIYAIRPES